MGQDPFHRLLDGHPVPAAVVGLGLWSLSLSSWMPSKAFCRAANGDCSFRCTISLLHTQTMR